MPLSGGQEMDQSRICELILGRLQKGKVGGRHCILMPRSAGKMPMLMTLQCGGLNIEDGADNPTTPSISDEVHPWSFLLQGSGQSLGGGRLFDIVSSGTVAS